MYNLIIINQLKQYMGIFYIGLAKCPIHPNRLFMPNKHKSCKRPIQFNEDSSLKSSSCIKRLKWSNDINY